MTSTTLGGFWSLYRTLPEDIRTSAKHAYRRWQADPFDRSLKFKEIKGKPGVWSVRLRRGYRAVGTRQGNHVEWEWVGSHPAYIRYISTR